jgi:prolyl oligopeptidase
VDAAACQSLYYHRIGTAQSADVLIVSAPEHPTWMFGAEVTDDGRYCVISVVDGCDPVNKVWLMDMRLPGNDPNESAQGFKVW